MVALGFHSLPLLCITLILTASLFAAGIQLTEDDEAARQRLQDHLIKQRGITLPRDKVFNSLDLQPIEDKYPGFASMLEISAWNGENPKIYHVPVPQPSPPLFSFRRKTRVHVFRPTYYMSVVDPQGGYGSLLGIRDTSDDFMRPLNEDPNQNPNRGKEGLVFWKHEGDTKRLLAIDLWSHRVDPEKLIHLTQLIPNHLHAAVL
ncbi:uncharacterized protein UTRI_10422 [Ustilago trichophora]|uniref:Effector family protein Eff1 n=1 Tax=Ustilago trichophora TaxID=86804 RepID=A0A5C3EBA5_9BASI|nr:uncharacterized protein UTRI_10422 [Ustilago trichophora]